MLLLYLPPLCLLSLAVFVVATIRARRIADWNSRTVQSLSAIIALGSGAYFWLWLSAFTLVTVTSRCPDYASMVSAGHRHSPVLSIGGTDYFRIINPQEGEIQVEGRSSILTSSGYVTSFGMERIDFWLDTNCKSRSEQHNIEFL